MKTKNYLLFLLLIVFASCSSLQQSTVNDDVYYSPKDELVASSDVYENPTYNKGQATLSKYDKEIAQILEDTTKSSIDTTIYENKYENPYDRLLVDTYSESYERRMEAMRSPYYGFNNSFIVFSDDYWYAQSYFNDPYYNVIIMGDQVWVEPYWMSSWYHRPSWSFRSSWYYRYNYPYYSSFYYSPFYSYYSPYYYHGYYNYYNPYVVRRDNHYVSSSFHSYRQRSVAGISGTRSVAGSAVRELPETYVARDVRSASTVKSGVDRQRVRSAGGTSSSATRTVRSRTSTTAGETIRVREATRTSTSGTSGVRTSTGSQSGSRNYTRPQQTTRSTYNSPSRSATRYNRPSSSNVNSGRSSSGVSRTSTYSPNQSSSTRSSSGSSYTPSRSRSSSGSSVNRSNGSSTRSSGSSVRSSGSSSRSSGSSSSGSSSRSSSGSSRGRR